MPRLLAFLAALLLAVMAVSTAGLAGTPQALRFTIGPDGRGGEIHANFRRNDGVGRDNDWSTSLPLREIAGLDLARLNAAGNVPVRFAVVREAGRLDCAGSGGHGSAAGDCGFAANPAFIGFLTSRGMRAPKPDEEFGLMALDVRRDLVEALARARYPVPTAGDLMAMTAIGVSGNYIAGLASAGYRPSTLDALVQFRALNITPDYIRGFVAMGYADMPAHDLVQLKALNIDAAYIAGFQRIGYGRLPAHQLVQLKALGVTPQFALSARRGRALVPPDRLVELRALGFIPR